MSFGLDCCCDWFSVVCRAWFGHQGESESFGSVPDAVSPALETEPRMPMRDVTEHEMETERARRGLLSTVHADIETRAVLEAFTSVKASVRASMGRSRSSDRPERCRGCEMKLQLVDWRCKWSLVIWKHGRDRGMRDQACQAS